MSPWRDVPERPLDPPDSYWGPCEGCGCETCICGIDDGDRGDRVNERQEEQREMRRLQSVHGMGSAAQLGVRGLLVPVGVPSAEDLVIPPERHRWEKPGDGRCLDCGLKRKYRRVFLGEKPGGYVVRGYVYEGGSPLGLDAWTTREPPCL